MVDGKYCISSLSAVFPPKPFTYIYIQLRYIYLQVIMFGSNHIQQRRIAKMAGLQSRTSRRKRVQARQENPIGSNCKGGFLMAYHYTFPASYLGKIAHTEEGFGKGPAKKVKLHDLLRKVEG